MRRSFAGFSALVLMATPLPAQAAASDPILVKSIVVSSLNLEAKTQPTTFEITIRAVATEETFKNWLPCQRGGLRGPSNDFSQYLLRPAIEKAADGSDIVVTCKYSLPASDLSGLIVINVIAWSFLPAWGTLTVNKTEKDVFGIESVKQTPLAQSASISPGVFGEIYIGFNAPAAYQPPPYPSVAGGFQIFPAASTTMARPVLAVNKATKTASVSCPGAASLPKGQVLFKQIVGYVVDGKFISGRATGISLGSYRKKLGATVTVGCGAWSWMVASPYPSFPALYAESPEVKFTLPKK